MAADGLFEEKLRLTLDRLFTQTRHRVQDDTLLHKLTDLFRNTLSADKDMSIKDMPTTRRREIILRVLNTDPWIPNLTQNHQLLNCHVTSFGLALIGHLAVAKACHSTLMSNAECLKMFIRDMTVNYVQLHTSLRCSIIVTLRNIWMAANKDLRDSLLSDIDIFGVLRCALMDGSYFVAGEAKSLASNYLISELNARDLQSSTDDVASRGDESRKCRGLLDWLVGFIKSPVTVDNDKNALVALEVFGDVLRRDSSVATRLCRLANLKMLAMDLLVNSEKEAICKACCFLLVSLNSWSFATGIPSEWLVVLEMLLAKPSYPPLSVASIFVMTTCQRFQSDPSLQIPVGLMAFMIEPIEICYEWKAKENGTNCWQSSKWWTPIRKNISNQCGLERLCCYNQANVLLLNEFLTNEEKLNFVKMLTFVVMETGNLLTLSWKIQTAALSVLKSLLDLTYDKGDPNGLRLTDEDRLKIWRNVINAAEQPSSSAQISTDRMRLIHVLLRGTYVEGFRIVWKDVSDRLCQLLQKRCHDVLWEIRDSSVETFGEVIQKSKDHPFLSDWCVSSGLLNVLIASMDDLEGYVRASILQVLSVIPTSSSDVHKEAAKLLPLERFIAIVLMDDEGIVRRAAANALMSWTFATKLSQSSFSHVANTFLIASADIDWEVKLISIEFWRTTLVNSIGTGVEAGSDLLKNLVEIGFCDAMTQLCTDQDMSVRHEMATLVRTFKALPLIKKLAVTNDEAVPGVTESNSRPPLNTVLRTVEAEFECMSDEAKYAAIDKVLETMDSILVNDVMVSRTEQPVFSPLESATSENIAKLDRLISNHHRFHRERIDAQKFLTWLRDLDLDALLEQSDKTTDIYENNPEALLDDLIVAHEESDTEEEISLDCY